LDEFLAITQCNLHLAKAQHHIISDNDIKICCLLFCRMRA